MDRKTINVLVIWILLNNEWDDEKNGFQLGMIYIGIDWNWHLIWMIYMKFALLYIRMKAEKTEFGWDTNSIFNVKCIIKQNNRIVYPIIKWNLFKMGLTVYIMHIY